MPKAATSKTVEKAAPAKRAKKDPNAPKGALSAYMMFSKDNRQKVLDDIPGIQFGQVGKELGARWGKMSDAEKKPYQDKAEADKLRAQKEKDAYAKSTGGTSKKAAPKKAAKAAPVEEDDDEEDDEE